MKYIILTIISLLFLTSCFSQEKKGEEKIDNSNNGVIIKGEGEKKGVGGPRYSGSVSAYNEEIMPLVRPAKIIEEEDDKKATAVQPAAAFVGTDDAYVSKVETGAGELPPQNSL